MEEKLPLKIIKQPLNNHGFTIMEVLISFSVISLFFGLTPLKLLINPVIPNQMIELSIIQNQLEAIANKETKVLPFLVNQQKMSFNHRGNISQANKGEATIYNKTVEITIWLGYGRFKIE